MMKQLKNGDEPINPTPGYDDVTGEDKGRWFGLTKREYFAALAMQGILSRSGNWNNVTDYNFIYHEAVRHADELLKQLDNGKNG